MKYLICNEAKILNEKIVVSFMIKFNNFPEAEEKWRCRQNFEPTPLFGSFWFGVLLHQHPSALYCQHIPHGAPHAMLNV